MVALKEKLERRWWRETTVFCFEYFNLWTIYWNINMFHFLLISVFHSCGRMKKNESYLYFVLRLFSLPTPRRQPCLLFLCLRSICQKQMLLKTYLPGFCETELIEEMWVSWRQKGVCMGAVSLGSWGMWGEAWGCAKLWESAACAPEEGGPQEAGPWQRRCAHMDFKGVLGQWAYLWWPAWTNIRGVP